MRRQRPGVDTYTVRVRQAAPQAIGIARALGALFGHGINGATGTTRYGMPAIGTRAKFSGYAVPPQLFIGYNPARVAGGSFRGSPAHLPATSNLNASNPLLRSMAAVTDRQMAG